MDLTELMDRYVVADGDAVDARDLDPLLAAGVWYPVVEHPAFRDRLREVGASGQVAGTVVVPHAGGTRYDLVVFDPAMDAGAEPVVAELRLDDFAPAALAYARVLRHLHHTTDAAVDDLRSALADFAGSRPFAVAVVGVPEFEWTAATVACPTGDRGTVGVAAVDLSGADVLTTAGHVVDGVPNPTVDGHAVTVVDHSRVVDIATLSHPGGIRAATPTSVTGQATVPGYQAPVSFDGAKSGPVNTVVTGTDPGIAAGLRHTAVRVYTQPATAGGDSGAALLDAQDRLVGFCSERTGLHAPIGMSTWVWAPQVFDVMDLRL